MIPHRIPTESPALMRFIRSDAVQEQVDEIKMLGLIVAIACALLGLINVIKQALELLFN